jgi:sulfide:quinone oxidoreductase
MTGTESYKVLIIGGGAAGISVAARLNSKFSKDEIAVIEPSDKHFYQPFWTLVGGGIVSKEQSMREEKDFIPDHAHWIRDAVTEFQPDANTVTTKSGKRIGYDFLVVAPGLQLDWNKVKGLPEALGTGGVCSNYRYDIVDKTFEFIRNFKGGKAVFTQPNTPIKCGGAPQKIAYLAEDYFRKHGVRDKADIQFISGAGVLFTSPYYVPALEEHIKKTGITYKLKHNLVEIRPESREAVFRNLDTDEELVQKYDLIHVTPPMGAPDFVKNSPLADAAGWVDVDKFTLRHTRYANIFSLGDASNLPTSKTGAAIRKQVPVVVENLLSATYGEDLKAKYDGYTSCPLVTGYDSLILAEFDYDLKPEESFPFDQRKERYSMYLLKRYVLPAMYWHGMLRGRA